MPPSQTSSAPHDGLAELAAHGGLRIAVAESLTSGQLAARVGAEDGASDWFAGGVVAYQSRTKQGVLGVRPGIDPCSAECAEEMAIGVRALLDADVAVSTTGVGGPDPEDGHPPGTVYVGWASAEDVGHALHHFDGAPEDVLAQTVDAAMSALLARARAATRSSR